MTFKNKVLEKAREEQQALINDFQKRIDDLRESRKSVNQGQYEHDQKSHDEQAMRKIGRLAEQQNMAVDEMDLLRKMRVDGEPHEEISLGSVVETDKATFYPSVSLEQFDVDGKEVIGVSEEAPIFKEMKGRQAGDTFSYNDTEYKIQDVY